MTTTIAAPQRLYLMQVATLPQINIPIVCYLGEVLSRLKAGNFYAGCPTLASSTL